MVADHRMPEALQTLHRFALVASENAVEVSSDDSNVPPSNGNGNGTRPS